MPLRLFRTEICGNTKSRAYDREETVMQETGGRKGAGSVKELEEDVSCGICFLILDSALELYKEFC